VPSSLQILNFASFQGPDQRIAGSDGRKALCTQQREIYADLLKPATYKKTQTSAEMKSLMPAYEHFSYIQLKQRVSRATEMDTVVAESSYYILRTQSPIQQTRFHYFKMNELHIQYSTTVVREAAK
jgi:hypothetical protein